MLPHIYDWYIVDCDVKQQKNITTQSVASPRLHKLISIYLHCDLDLWPLTSKINRVHPLIMVNMYAKFDKEICNGLVSIVFTRSTHGRTEPRTHGRTEPQQRYYIPTATRCAGIISTQTNRNCWYALKMQKNVINDVAMTLTQLWQYQSACANYGVIIPFLEKD